MKKNNHLVWQLLSGTVEVSIFDIQEDTFFQYDPVIVHWLTYVPALQR